MPWRSTERWGDVPRGETWRADRDHRQEPGTVPGRLETPPWEKWFDARNSRLAGEALPQGIEPVRFRIGKMWSRTACSRLDGGEMIFGASIKM